jgi:hypothetical protein
MSGRVAPLEGARGAASVFGLVPQSLQLYDTSQ